CARQYNFDVYTMDFW
nr:immunoglobulin heavy chain junction region [Mus musculus]